MNRNLFVIVSVCVLTALGMVGLSQVARADEVMWINHLDFVPGDSAVQTATAPGGGLTIQTIPQIPLVYGGKVEKGLEVPPGYLVTGVRVCYTTVYSGSISEISITQLWDSTAAVTVPLHQLAVLTNPVFACADTTAAALINQDNGPLRLTFGVSLPMPNDAVVLQGVGLYLRADANSLQEQIRVLNEKLENLTADFENHTHTYLTGIGVGHNNTQAVTTGPTIGVSPAPLPAPVPPPAPAPAPKPGKKK
jgi:hypothetical protein